MKTPPSFRLVAAAGLCVAAIPAFADVDYDDASQSAYADGWQNLDDGSINPDGFGGWIFGGNASDPSTVFIASSAGNSGATTIDTTGLSFGIHDTDGTGDFIDVFRFIDGGDLAAGETLSFDLDVNFRGGNKGVTIRGADDSSSIFNFNIGGDDYVVSDVTTGGGSVGNTYSPDTIFNITLEQVDGTGGTWTVTRSGGVSDIDTGTYSGVVSSFQLYSGGQGGSAEDAIYYNNFEIIPEPGSFALIAGLAGLSFIVLRRRKA